MSCRQKYTLYLTSCFILMMNLGGRSVFAQGTTAIVSCQVASASISMGERTELTLKIESVVNFYGYKLTLSYDPALIEIRDGDTVREGVNAQLGDFIKQDLVQLNEIVYSGELLLNVRQVAPAAALSGSGELATVLLQGNANGIARFWLSDVSLYDVNGTEITYEIKNCSLEIAGQPIPTITATPTATSTEIPSTTTPTATTVPPTATATTTSSPTTAPTNALPTAAATPTLLPTVTSTNFLSTDTATPLPTVTAANPPSIALPSPMSVTSATPTTVALPPPPTVMATAPASPLPSATVASTTMDSAVATPIVSEATSTATSWESSTANATPTLAAAITVAAGTVVQMTLEQTETSTPTSGAGVAVGPTAPMAPTASVQREWPAAAHPLTRSDSAVLPTATGGYLFVFLLLGLFVVGVIAFELLVITAGLFFVRLRVSKRELIVHPSRRLRSSRMRLSR